MTYYVLQGLTNYSKVMQDIKAAWAAVAQSTNSQKNSLKVKKKRPSSNEMNAALQKPIKHVEKMKSKWINSITPFSDIPPERQPGLIPYASDMGDPTAYFDGFVKANLSDEVDYGSIFEEVDMEDHDIISSTIVIESKSDSAGIPHEVTRNEDCDSIKVKYVRNIDRSKTFNRRPIFSEPALEEHEIDWRALPVEVKVVGRIAYSESFCIGNGSLGTKVFVGLHDEHGNAAIKKFPKRGVDDQKGRLLLELAEIEKNMLLSICRSGRHKNVVEYLGFEEDDHNYYLALELCDFSLHAVYNLQEMEEARSFFRNPNMQKEFVSQLLSGLAFLHSLQIVHGDFRPKNVLLDLSYRVKIADFGLSSKVDCKDDSFSWGTQPHGADGWFAPEVYLEERKTMAVDIFSAGCIIFMVLTDGHHPFHFNPYHIVRDIFDGSPLVGNPEAFDLCGWMLAHTNFERPLATEALEHPFLWSAEQRVSYLKGVCHDIDKNRKIVEDFLVWLPQVIDPSKLRTIRYDEAGTKRWFLPPGSDSLNKSTEGKLSWMERLPADLRSRISR